MNDWKAPIQQALEQATGLKIRFSASMQSMTNMNGVVAIAGAVLEPDSEHDEESLPFLLVKGEDGKVFEACESELEALGPVDGLLLGTLVEAVCKPFAVARDDGWTGPSQLMSEASDAKKASFLASL